MSTGHANSPQDMLSRLETMALFASDIPSQAIRKQIASSIDIIVQLERLRDRSRRVTAIAEVLDCTEDAYILNPKRLPSVRQKTEMLPVWNSGYDRLPPSFITFRYARENLLINVTITFIISKTHTPVKVGNMAGNLSTTGGEHAVAYSPLRAVSPTLSIRYTVPQGGFSVLPGRCGTHCNTGSALNFRPFYLAIGLGTHRDFTANLFVVQAFATYHNRVLEQFQVVAKLQVNEFLIQILSHL